MMIFIKNKKSLLFVYLILLNNICFAYNKGSSEYNTTWCDVKTLDNTTINIWVACPIYSTQTTIPCDLFNYTTPIHNCSDSNDFCKYTCGANIGKNTWAYYDCGCSNTSTISNISNKNRIFNEYLLVLFLFLYILF
jgi:hypothetical protein